jgi:low temperature requirement protein LtrA
MLRIALWWLAIVLDTGGPYLFGAEGWTLVPEDFAERHGAIIIIALGESIVAIGAGASVDVAVLGAAVLGVVVACALWWLYFDVVSIAAERRLIKASAGRERNEIARDSYSYLHFPMVAGIVLVAAGLKQTLAHVSTPLGVVTASAMLGAAAMYLLAHVAFRWRNMHMLPRHRLIAELLLSAILLVELIAAPAALITLGLLALVLCVLILYEVRRFAELRARLRHQLAQESPAG